MKISDKQKSAMFAFLKNNPNMICGTYSTTYTQHDGRKRWEELTEKLNRIGVARKSWKSWRKTWQDMRSRAKLKRWGRNKRKSVENGECVDESVSKCDEDILEVCNVVSVQSASADVFTSVTDSVTGINSTGFEDFEITEEFVAIKTEETQNGLQLEEEVENPTVIKTERVDVDEVPTFVEKHDSRKISIPSAIERQRNSTSRRKYRNLLERKLQLKANYYRKKIALLKHSISVKQQSAKALTRIADVLETMQNF